MSRSQVRALAAHVQAAVGAGQGVWQAKMGKAVPPGGRVLAPHVQAAVAAGQGVGQAKIGGGGPLVAAHVQAAIVSAQAKSAAVPTSRSTRAHVRQPQAHNGQAIQPATAALVVGGGLVVAAGIYALSKCLGPGGNRPNPDNADLSGIAQAINGLHDYNDISTLAVAQRTDGSYAIYVQRGYDIVRRCDEILERVGIDPPIDYVEASDEGKHNMHAEMLAISEWLAEGRHPRPTRIGASRGICEYCHRILVHLGVREYNVAGNTPTNWCSPYWYNGMENPIDTVPNKRTKGHNY